MKKHSSSVERVPFVFGTKHKKDGRKFGFKIFFEKRMVAMYIFFEGRTQHAVSCMAPVEEGLEYLFEGYGSFFPDYFTKREIAALQKQFIAANEAWERSVKKYMPKFA